MRAFLGAASCLAAARNYCSPQLVPVSMTMMVRLKVNRSSRLSRPLSVRSGSGGVPVAEGPGLDVAVVDRSPAAADVAPDQVQTFGGPLTSGESGEPTGDFSCRGSIPSAGTGQRQMGAQGTVLEGDTAVLDGGTHIGREHAQPIEVSVDSAPQHPVVEVPAAAQCQTDWPVVRREIGEGRAQERNCLDRELPEERQGDVPVLDAVPSHARVCVIGGAQFPGEFFFRVVGRGERDEHAHSRGLGLIVHTGLRTAPGSGCDDPGTAGGALAVANAEEVASEGGGKPKQETTGRWGTRT